MLVREWEPEPLVPRTKDVPRVEEEDLPVIKGPMKLNVTLTTGEELQNWGVTNFLGLQNNEEVTEAAIKTVREYGVGACGPAGFYGSMDVHLELEKQIAKILDVEEAIVYSQGFMAVASVIPAFSKRGDIIVADSGVSFAVQVGLEVSRSHVYYFAHNDVEDLERILQQVDEDCRRKKMPLSRRFIVVEGLYAKHGDKCPLPQLLKIKKQHKYRLIVDESLSFGCLGPYGRGISDYFGVPASEIEIITGSFSNALGSSGGFCAGSHNVVDHQRLSSQAYCFSAALPALLTVSASLALNQIEGRPQLLQDLRRNTAVFNSAIKASLPKRFIIEGDIDSPLRFVRLATRHEDPEHEVAVMNSLIVAMRSHGYLVTRDKHVANREKYITSPSVKICISGGFSEREVKSFSSALIESMRSI
jgi:serine palmitoyltransferase